MAEKKTAKKKASKKKVAAKAAPKKAASKKTASKKTASKKSASKKTSSKKTASRKAASKPAEKKPAAPAKAKSDGGRLRVTLVRSVNGTIGSHRATVRGLGLRRMHHTVELEDTPAIRGMIRKVDYLVKVEKA